MTRIGNALMSSSECLDIEDCDYGDSGSLLVAWCPLFGMPIRDGAVIVDRTLVPGGEAV